MKTASLLILLSFSAEVLSAQTCVLAFERSSSPIGKTVAKVMKKFPDDITVLEAKPEDIIKCVDQGASKIILIAHSTDVNAAKRLVYFRRLQGEERAVAIQKKIELLGQLNTPKARKELDFYRTLNDQTVLYDQPRQILPNIFRKLQGMIIGPLNKIVLATCDAAKVFSSYPALAELAGQNGAIEFSPESWFWTKIRKKSVSNFSAKWLRKQLRKP